MHTGFEVCLAIFEEDKKRNFVCLFFKTNFVGPKTWQVINLNSNLNYFRYYTFALFLRLSFFETALKPKRGDSS